jgi:hypothetical protein
LLAQEDFFILICISYKELFPEVDKFQRFRIISLLFLFFGAKFRVLYTVSKKAKIKNTRFCDMKKAD